MMNKHQIRRQIVGRSRRKGSRNSVTKGSRHFIHVTVEDDLYEELTAMADDSHSSLSSVVRDVIRVGLLAIEQELEELTP